MWGHGGSTGTCLLEALVRVVGTCLLEALVRDTGTWGDIEGAWGHACWKHWWDWGLMGTWGHASWKHQSGSWGQEDVGIWGDMGTCLQEALVRLGIWGWGGHGDTGTWGHREDVGTCLLAMCSCVPMSPPMSSCCHVSLCPHVCMCLLSPPCPCAPPVSPAMSPSLLVSLPVAVYPPSPCLLWCPCSSCHPPCPCVSPCPCGPLVSCPSHVLLSPAMSPGRCSWGRTRPSPGATKRRRRRRRGRDRLTPPPTT